MTICEALPERNALSNVGVHAMTVWGVFSRKKSAKRCRFTSPKINGDSAMTKKSEVVDIDDSIDRIHKFDNKDKQRYNIFQINIGGSA